MPALLAVPFVLLVVVALTVAASNLVAGKPSPAARDLKSASQVPTALLLATVPLGFLASSLDCTGLSPQGCTPFCTFIKIAWIPAVAVACAAYAKWRLPGLLSLTVLMSFVPLAPHCLCFNVGNGWWIERLGASPTCYAWGFMTSLLAVGALRTRRRKWSTLLVSGAIIGGAIHC